MGRKTRVSTIETKRFADILDELVKGKKEECGITQKAICEEAGVRESSLIDWLNDEASPTLEAINKLADYFEVSTDYLLGRTGTRSPDPDLEVVVKYTGLTETAIEIIKSLSPHPMAPELQALNSMIESYSFQNLIFDFVNLSIACNMTEDEINRYQTAITSMLENTPPFLPYKDDSLTLLKKLNNCEKGINAAVFSLTETVMYIANEISNYKDSKTRLAHMGKECSKIFSSALDESEKKRDM